uniref:MIR domain-containing protein n=1 Tax=Syphacia muris TaxID=451379 RepID=A0A0N5AIL6_9BILA
MDIKFMPLLFVNFAGEMIYILNQRLQAQHFDSSKSRKILTDLIQAMFEKRFVEELFKLQNIYTRHSLKVFFEKFAHCSIMRLTDNSMDKLYDLMTMTVKYQIETCITPNHILSISLNHIDGIRKILPEDQESLILLQFTHNKKYKLKCNQMGKVEINFQETRVRISSFLREKKQLSNGHYVLFPTRWIEIATNVEVPGKVRNYFYDTKGERTVCEGKFNTGTKDYTYIKNIAEVSFWYTLTKNV